ncbi:c-type cytochrome [Azospirillum sp. TSO22-1]|uniref:c-type cytochrome n=1 Tax=Azospirillum sp. TSO22-1 TaxID=716789 RepID=UPI001304E4C1|nr:c-type cytochrome [Azospirillum sp. TSO22-1]
MTAPLRTALLAASLLIVPGMAAAQQAPAAAPAAQSTPAPAAQAEGKKLFLGKTCIACHGRDGSKAIQMYPNIAGLDAAYTLRQMDEIASGDRLSGNDARGYPRTQGMKDVMHLVSAEERKAIADWLSSLPPPKLAGQPADAERVAKGKALYEASECVACHGPDGKEPQAEMPAVGGQKREYIALQIKEIRDGIRKNGMAESMVPFAQKLNDEQAELVADYLAQVDRSAK